MEVAKGHQNHQAVQAVRTIAVRDVAQVVGKVVKARQNHQAVQAVQTVAVVVVAVVAVEDVKGRVRMIVPLAVFQVAHRHVRADVQADVIIPVQELVSQAAQIPVILLARTLVGAVAI